MAIRFSLAHLTVLGCPPPEMTYLAADAGYDLVSFRPIYMGLPNEPNYALAQNPTMLKATKRALADTGLSLSDIELARIHDELDPRSYLPAFQVAAELGCRSVISSVWTARRDFAVEAFGNLCDLAAPLGLNLELEFVSFAELRSLGEAADFLRAVGRSNVGILVDTLHFHRSRVSPEELEGLPPAWFRVAHLCDAAPEIPSTKEGLIHTARDERLYLGEGGIDVAAILSRLPSTLTYSIELPHLARVAEYGYAEHARRCLSTARAYLAKRGLAAPVEN